MARTLVALVAMLAVIAATESASATLRTPGYKGVRKAPKVRSGPPPSPVVLDDMGKNPQVLVDAAGTAHIVWTDENTVQEADVTHYCRIKRGTRSCDAQHALVPPQDYSGGNFPGGNAEFSPARVLASGDDLIILSYRYPNVVDKPDGASSGALYMWTSDNGGTTITGPGLVGDLETSGVPVVYGTADSPRVGVISDTKTGGTFFQEIRPGQYNGDQANLAGPDQNRAYSGSLALLGQVPIAAFADLGDQTFVRAWTGNGSIQNPATWTNSPPFPGSEPRLASGPSGVYILDRPQSASHYEVRRLEGGGVSPGVRVSDTDSANYRDFFQDPGGRLHAGWMGDFDPVKAWIRASFDGRRWLTSRQVGRATADQNSLTHLDMSAAFDGGGFAVFVRSTGGGIGTVLAAPYGNQFPTGRTGLGSLAGAGVDPDVSTSCQEINFGDVRILGHEGCFLTATTGPRGTKVSEGPIRLNGLDFVPDPGVRILINPRERTIDTTGKVRVLGSIRGTSPVEFVHDRLALKLPRARGSTAQGGAGRRGTILMSIDTEKYPTAVKGFPVAATFEIEIFDDGSAAIEMSLKLPKAFIDITGEVELELDNDTGLKIDSLHMQAKKVPVFGVVYLENFELKYQASGDQWTSNILMVLPPLPVGPKVGGSVTFKGGKLVQAFIEAGPPYPGLKIAPAAFLTSIGGGFGIDPNLTIIATATIGALPIVPRSYTVGVRGRFTLEFGTPVTFALTGSGQLFDQTLQTAFLRANTDGYVAAGGAVELDLEAVSVEGELDSFVDAGNNFQFGGRVLGKICVAGACLTRGEAVVSSRGIGACITTGITYGFTYAWGASPFDVDLKGPFTCDLSEYAIVPPPAGGAAPGFDVAAGTDTANVRMRGQGGQTPSVTLVAPGGERITPVNAAFASENDRAVVMNGSNGAAYVGIKNPQAGRWTVESQPALAELALADAQSPPQVSGGFGGGARGSATRRQRSFSYRATRRRGLQITFLEEGPGVANVIGRATERRGTIRFRPAVGPRGRRTIVAVGEQDGLPRFREEVASYVAPKPPKPGRVRRVRVRRRKGGIQVRWRRAAGAAAYTIRARLSDGRTLFDLVPARRRKVRFGGVDRRTRARITIVARDPSGRKGRPGKARLRR